MRVETNQAGPIRWRYVAFNCGALACAIYTTVQEGWDANADGLMTLQEFCLVFVRLLAFPVHVVLQLTPSSILALLGCPIAPWPGTALVAVALGIPLWGMVLIGGLIVEAWIEVAGETGANGVRAQQRARSLSGLPKG